MKFERADQFAERNQIAALEARTVQAAVRRACRAVSAT